MTPDEERLLRLMRQLGSNPAYASGAERFPEAVGPEDGAKIAADLQVAVDHGVELREARAAAQGAPVACRPGCTSCCEQLVGVWAPEVELVVAWLADPAHTAERAAFLRAYPRWLEQSRASIAEVAERTAAGDEAGQARALAAHWRRRVLCAFNEQGLCSIYPVRPIVCRTCHALGTSDDCLPDDETISRAAVMHFVPLERLLEKSRALSRAAHLALGGRELPLVLCEAVAARLGSPAP